VSARTRLIVAGVLAFIVCLVFFFVFIRPRNAELERVTNEVTAAKGEQDTLRDQLASLEALRKNAPELQAELNEIRELIPKRDDFYNFMLQMIDAADAAGVGLDQLDPEFPAPALEAPALAEITILIRAQGGYFGLQDFTRRVQELDRAVSISGSTLTTVEGEETEQGGASAEGSVLLEMTVRVFFETPEVQAPVPVPGEVPAPTDGAATPAPGATPAPATTPATTPAPAG
jgi:Tfp pilus assembly protein PilO